MIKSTTVLLPTLADTNNSKPFKENKMLEGKSHQRMDIRYIDRANGQIRRAIIHVKAHVDSERKTHEAKLSEKIKGPPLLLHQY